MASPAPFSTLHARAATGMHVSIPARELEMASPQHRKAASAALVYAAPHTPTPAQFVVGGGGVVMRNPATPPVSAAGYYQPGSVSPLPPQPLSAGPTVMAGVARAPQTITVARAALSQQQQQPPATAPLRRPGGGSLSVQYAHYQPHQQQPHQQLQQHPPSLQFSPSPSASPQPTPLTPSPLSPSPSPNAPTTAASVVMAAGSVVASAPLLARIASVASDPVAAAKAAQALAREAARPDTTKAERYRNLTCPRVRDTSKGSYSLYNIWKFTDREFLQYGLGVMLWFKLVRRLSWLFLVLFVLNLPSIVVNLHGPDDSSVEAAAALASAIAAANNASSLAGGSGSSSNSAVSSSTNSDQSLGLSHTTLSHQGLTLTATIFGYSKPDVGLIIGALDTLSCLIYLVATLAIFHSHRTQASKYNSNVMTVRRFTILVTDLPHRSPEPLGRLEIADFFQSRFGPVVDVSISYNDMALLAMFRARGELRREMQTASAQGASEEVLKKLQKALRELDHNLAFKRRIHRRQIRAAFVTFQMQESVTKALGAYPDSRWSRCFTHRSLKFLGRTPRVSRAAEPSNTLFQNLGLSAGDLWCRRAWTGLVSLALMSLSFAAVFVSQYYQSSTPTSSTCAQANISTQEQVTDEDSRFCFCAGLSAAQLYSDSSFCKSYLVKFALAKGLVFMTAASTVLVNALLQVFMDKLATLERHSSVTSQQRGITSRLFWGLFFNTGVIILIVNTNLSPYLRDSIPIVSILPGRFADFTPEWFFAVGVSIMITMFLNSMNPHLLSLLAIPYDNCRRRRCAKRAKNQAELNTLYSGRRFVLFERYSVLLNTAFVCLMFSSGMPILWLVAAATFAATYWFDKITFLRSYRIPPRYDESLDEYAAHILPGAVVPHLMLAIWFFSSPMTLSHPLGDIIPFAEGASASSSNVGLIRTGVASLKERMFQWNTFPSVLLLLLLAGLWLAAKLYAMIFFCRASELEQRNARLGAEELKSRTRAVTYTEACAKVGLESYRISRQHEYRPAFIVTESKKQLPVELDLHLLREWEANVKAGKTNAKIKGIQDGARQKEMQKNASSSIAPNKVAPMPAAAVATIRAGGVAAGSSSNKYAVASPTVPRSPSPSLPPGAGGARSGGSASVDLGRTAPAAAWSMMAPPRPSQIAVSPSPLGAPSPAASSSPPRPLGLHKVSASVQVAGPTSSYFAQQRQMQQLQPSQAQQQFQQQLQQQQSQSPPSTAASSSSSGGQLLAAPAASRGRPAGHNSAHSISLAPWGTTTPGGSNGHNTEQVHVVPSFDQDAQPLAQVTEGASSFAAGAPGAAGGAPAVSDTVLLGMAAAVADPTQGSGYALLPISCPSCANLFQIVDCGEAMSYSCPFCSAQTII